MTQPPSSNSSEQLSDPSYRAEMLSKIEALISVLQVARTKVILNMDTPGVSSARLARVKLQVENTLKVCRKARTALSGSTAISSEEISNTDIDALCAQLGEMGS